MVQWSFTPAIEVECEEWRESKYDAGEEIAPRRTIE
jgi:hypothetical protein